MLGGSRSAQGTGPRWLIFYRANREHLACPAVEVLAGLRRQPLSRIIDHVGTWLVPALTVAVFGSLARGEGGTDSDVDLLLVHGDDLTDELTRSWEQQVDALVAAGGHHPGRP